MSDVIHLSTAAFEKVNALSQPVLIDFWAPWCGPCKRQSPILDEVATRMGDRALVAKVNVDDDPALAARFGVQSIPTLVILKGGEVQARMVGLQDADRLVTQLEAAGA